MSERQSAMHPRQGPRPLPLHLTVAAATWAISRAALPFLKSESPNWNPALQSRANELLEKLKEADPEALQSALDSEIQARAGKLLEGIERYRHHPYRRDLPDPPTVWSEGTTRLLDYGEGKGQPVFIVPSLVNRYYILDLSARCSLLRWLKDEGFRPLVVDWDRPGEIERGFDLTAYIAGRLERALGAALELSDARRMPVVGYCMGGDLALALAQRRPREVGALALLATPWDFHAGQGDFAKSAPLSLIAYEPLMALLGELPVDALQALFAGLDPELVVRKFLKFADLEGSSRSAETFVALEDWLNDGVPLAAPVARETIKGWYGENSPASGTWLIAGEAVDPSRVRQPALCLIPAGDRIVPPASALALADALPNVEVRQPHAGHIGMVVSGHARTAVWEPLALWIAGHGA